MASAATANRFTANPCASSKVVKALIQADRNPGCDVPAIDWVIPARVPGWPCDAPCQNPRPGQACSTAIPARNSPRPAMISRPSRRVCQARSGSAIRAAGDRVEEHRAGRAEQPGQAGGEDAAEGFAEHPDHQAPADAGQPGQPGQRAARRQQHPQADPDLDPHRRGAGLHRVIGPGGAAHVHQALHPLRRGRRQGLDDLRREPDRHLRLGLQDPVEDPQQAEADAQQPTPGGLGQGRAVRPGPAPAPAAAGVQVRTVTQARPSIAKISSAISPWCTSAALNAATTAGSLTLSPEFIPGMALLPRAARCRPRQRGRVLARPAAGRGRAGR